MKILRFDELTEKNAMDASILPAICFNMDLSLKHQQKMRKLDKAFKNGEIFYVLIGKRIVG